MSWPGPTKGWRSSSSRLLALYSFLFVVWGSLIMGSLYWEVSTYLDRLSAHSLLSRAHLFTQFEGEKLDAALATGQAFDDRVTDAYGLFSADEQPLGGKLRRIPKDLLRDGQVHALRECDQLFDDANKVVSSCDALLLEADQGRKLLLARDNGSLGAVSRIIFQALLWGISLTLIPGLIGWRLLSRRPQRRIQQIQACAEAIVAGDLERRLPLSARRDELDMLALIVNGMLDRIVQLMQEVKGVCDSVAHDLRTPLTHVRAQLHRLRQGAMSVGQAEQIDRVIIETDSLMQRFRALLRISELEDHRRRSSFESLPADELLRELVEFYLPLAEERDQILMLECPEGISAIRGDRALLFEAIGNVLSNALKFTPIGGRIILRGIQVEGYCCIEVQDSGPGVPQSERDAVFRRLFRGRGGNESDGFGLGLSIVAAILGLHGFSFHIEDGELGGACFFLECRSTSALS